MAPDPGELGPVDPIQILAVVIDEGLGGLVDFAQFVTLSLLLVFLAALLAISHGILKWVSVNGGQTLDGIGGFTCYGSIDNSEVCQSGNLLPMGLSEGCTLLRDVPRDYSITYADVKLPEERLADRLRAEQQAFFGSA